jgi:hypothetical protein
MQGEGINSTEHSTDDEVTDSHTHSPEDEKWSSSSLVDEEIGDTRENDEECVLHARGDQVDVTSKSGHGEDVCEINISIHQPVRIEESLTNDVVSLFRR